MSGENRKNENTNENESTTESDTEIENSFHIIKEETESSTEMFKVKVDANDVITVEELLCENSENKSSDSEATNIVYEFPDDSEFCQSYESISNLRKRPSDTSIENSSKKPRNGISTSQEVRTAVMEECDIGGLKNRSSESNADWMAQRNNGPSQLSPILLGLQHKREGETKNSEEAKRTSNTPGRFTKHKGDTKCQHGNFHGCSSEGEDADVEDNAEDSSMTISESSKSPPKETQAPTAETQLQSTIKDLVKKHIKPLPDNKKSNDSRSKPISGNKKLNDCVSTTTSGYNKSDDFVTKPTAGNKKKNNCSIKGPTTTKSSLTTTNKTKMSASSAKTKPKPDASSNSQAKNPKKSANSNKTLDSKSETSSSGLNTPNDKSQMTKKNKRRCGVCNKKLGLTATPCRCEGIFCAIHRYDREHNCTFDYKGVGAEEIRKNNPKIIGERVRKI
ncbi:hypothetical protein JTE90_001756 [Oedothorax gibbosus]|uniref:AN1-type domain-containing protein n=1 Tax=Oedothorax gibbosus TaxID=931172 RepID=A0AAV6VU16_9ARAC|nr:hypothetical protein JTE90_001756 [Oedothorax gibbosus]